MWDPFSENLDKVLTREKKTLFAMTHCPLSGMGRSSALVHGISGACAGVVSTVVLFPLDRYKRRAQVDTRVGAHKLSTTGLFDGLPMAILSQMHFRFWSYFLIEKVERLGALLLGRKMREQLGSEELFALSLVSSALTSVVNYPLSLLVTLMQTDQSAPKKSAYQHVHDVIKEDGFLGLWRGVSTSLFLVINPALTRTIFKYIQNWTIKSRIRLDSKTGTPGARETLIASMIAKLIAMSITYPIEILRARLQRKHCGTRSYNNVFDTACELYRRLGIRGLYR